MAPAWVLSRVDGQPSSPVTQGIEMVIMKRIHWLEYLGIVCGVIGLFFTVRNYFVHNNAGRNERGAVGILSRIIGRSID
jgi:drug/metabolite transporter (DMT)-like permease